MTTNKLTQYMRKSAGYTIDQTILIVAVIAVLITLIIASVGWDLLNRTSGTKFASYLKQIEEANGAFYARQGVWPHVAVADEGAGGTEIEANLAVLADVAVLNAGTQYVERWKPYLNGFDVVNDGTAGAEVWHQFGSGGMMTQDDMPRGSAECPDGASHLVITINDVPATELNNADEAIDGEINNADGRLQWGAPVGGIATATYCANLLD